jgi:nicotinate-nucleotide adenylyltransferase
MRIGLFGGTFNPIHTGHVTLAKNVFRDFKLDKLIIIPSHIPPHKKTCDISPELRFEMVQMVAQKLGEGFEVSDFEVVSAEVSYTYKTLKQFRKDYPDACLFFVAGTDIFATIDTWQYWRDLFDISNFIVVNRSSLTFKEMFEKLPVSLKDRLIMPDEYNNEKYGKIILYRMPEVDISSTEIRDMLDEEYRKANLPDDVYEFIETNKLYRSSDG